MRDTGTDERAAAANELSPAELAERVSLLTDGEAGTHGGRLPMWGRLERPPSPSKWSRRMFAVAWCVTLGLLAIAALRVLWHDGTVVLTWFNAFTQTIYLPAYFVLAWAAWKRHWWLATASAIVVACHLAWIAPDFAPATPFVPPVADSEVEPQAVRIFYVNVLSGNTDLNGLVGEAVQADADVIVFAELHRWWFQQLAKSNFLSAYPYGTNLKRRHMGDVNVFSRLPVSRQHLITSQGRVCNVVDIPLGAETLRLFCLHSPRPLLDGGNQYEEFWDEIEPVLAEQTEPLVVLGDFNATQHSQLYERLTSGRLRSAHDDRGRGYATTWPNGRKPFPPIRIDQAFLSPQVECVSITEGVGSGSDHKPLIIDLRIHSSKRAAN